MYETRSSVSRPTCPWPVFFQRKKVERGGLPRSVRASSLESSHSSAIRKNVRSAGPDRRSGSAAGLAAFLGAVRTAGRDTVRRDISTKQDYSTLIVQNRTTSQARAPSSKSYTRIRQSLIHAGRPLLHNDWRVGKTKQQLQLPDLDRVDWRPRPYIYCM